MRAKPAQLILKSGEIFDGDAFGYTKEKVGELVFNTSMTGYQEIITDLLSLIHISRAHETQ